MKAAIKKGDWVCDGRELIGKAKSDPYESFGSWHLDVVIYDRNGDRVGRTSPACGGPANFEPACDLSQWFAIQEPRFPLSRWADLEEVVERTINPATPEASP